MVEGRYKPASPLLCTSTFPSGDTTAVCDDLSTTSAPSRKNIPIQFASYGFIIIDLSLIFSFHPNFLLYRRRSISSQVIFDSRHQLPSSVAAGSLSPQSNSPRQDQLPHSSSSESLKQSSNTKGPRRPTLGPWGSKQRFVSSQLKRQSTPTFIAVVQLFLEFQQSPCLPLQQFPLLFLALRLTP